MGFISHGERKYDTSQLLLSSRERPWRTIAADLRSHPIGTVAAIPPMHTEITIAIAGSTVGHVTRTGSGQLQKTTPASGTVWLTPVGVRDNVIDISAALPKVLHLYLSDERFHALADDYDLPQMPSHSIRYTPGRDEFIRHIGLAILQEMSAETSSGHVLVEASALALAARLVAFYGENGNTRQIETSSSALDDRRMQRVVDFIEARLETPISLAELSEVACLSVFHFSRAFKARTGRSPARYLSDRRLQMAKAHLETNVLTLHEIAFRAQFSSQASFTRAFQRAIGIAPGRFRRMRLGE